jgi:hypothetical protein
MGDAEHDCWKFYQVLMLYFFCFVLVIYIRQTCIVVSEVKSEGKNQKKDHKKKDHKKDEYPQVSTRASNRTTTWRIRHATASVTSQGINQSLPLPTTKSKRTCQITSYHHDQPPNGPSR